MALSGVAVAVLFNACGGRSERDRRETATVAGRPQETSEDAGASGVGGSQSGLGNQVEAGQHGELGGSHGSPEPGGGAGGATEPLGDGGSVQVSAGRDGGGAEDGGTSGEPCTPGEMQVSARMIGRSGASSGFAGSEEEYTELYDMSCFSDDDCVLSCTDRGGTEEMCEAAICQDSIEDYCLPSTIWTELDRVASEGTSAADCAELVLWSDPYRDYLRVTDFGFEVPETAEVSGITVTVRRAANLAGVAFDAGVHLLVGGVMAEADRSRAESETWGSPAIESVEYGGAADSWGETLTGAAVNAPNFGVALAAGYARKIGNARAYVDAVYMTVHYRTTCE